MPTLTSSAVIRADAPLRQPSPAWLAAGALVTFVLVFAYRWLTVVFTNDQFVHLSRARQIVLGDVPVRDFFDPGMFLQYYASAAALYVSGGTLLGEAVLTIFFISLGAALVYVMATRVAQSWIIGAAATATAVLTFPRLYNYPKCFLFVLAIACVWRYQIRPTRTNLLLIAATTALAFLFRHDYGVYVGIAVVAFLLLRHWPGSSEGGRPLASALALYTGVTMLLVLPFLVFIQSVIGIPRYFASLTSQAREITTVHVNAPPVHFDWTKPLVRVYPPSEQRIHVRWKAEAGDEARRERERRYGLSRPIADEGTTWSYVITDRKPGNIAALLTDPLVDDTHGIDRERAEIAFRESPFQRAQRWTPVLRMQIAPGVLTFENALAWLYYVTLILPVIAVLTLIVRRTNSYEALDGAGDLAMVGMLIVLCVIVGQSLVRESPETRLPDAAAPLAVLGAWLAGVWTRGSTRHVRARIAATLAFGSVTLWAAAAFGGLSDHIVAAGLLSGPGGVVERFEKMNEYLTTRPPIDAWNDNDSVALRALAQWVRACTAPSDRLLVVGWASDLFFYAERPFAGGQVYLYPNWHSSPDDQRLTVERLNRQRVPIAISPVEGEPATRKSFPIVLDYVDQHYRHVARGNFGSRREYDVLVRLEIPAVGTYEPLHLPCYR
jgi:hypothetical protein